MNKLRVGVLFGTRPEAIKMAPLVLELKKEVDFETVVIVTGQHKEMLDQVLELFEIEPDYNLAVMKKNQTLPDVTSEILLGLTAVLKKEKLDLVLVHGDTTTTFIGSLACFYEKIPVGHVEAGLRTDNKYSPFPEEINRRLTGVIGELHFAPTKKSYDNLLKDGISDNIYITGNTVIDALLTVCKKEYDISGIPGLEGIDKNKRIILLTAHRRENLGTNMENIFRGLREVLIQNEDVQIVFPIHMNPKVREIAYREFSGVKNIIFIEPLEYRDFVTLMKSSYLILTDSGGVQEEAPSLNIPVLVLRDTTERPEAIESGSVKLLGVSPEDIIRETNLLLNNSIEYKKMTNNKNPYGDGLASKKIVKIIRGWKKLCTYI